MLMLGVGEETTGAKIHIILDDETSLKVVFRIVTGNLDLVIRRIGLLLCFQNLVEMPRALLGLKQGVGNDKTIRSTVRASLEAMTKNH